MHCSQQSLPLLGSILMNVFLNFATIVRKWKSKRFAKFNLFCKDFLKVPKRTRLFIVQFIFASAFLLASHIVEVKQLARHADVVERPALTARHAGRAQAPRADGADGTALTARALTALTKDTIE